MADWPVATLTSAAINSALASAARGDTVSLTQGATYIGTVTLPVKAGFTGANYVTLRTAPHGSFPAAGTRITRGHAAVMAKIHPVHISSSQNEWSLKTAAACQGYKVECIEFQQAMYGGSSMVQFGYNDSSQKLLALQPDNIHMRACFLNGRSHNHLWAHKRGIGLHGKNLSITDSVIDNVGSPTTEGDSIGIYALNGEGPYTITNNEVNGGTINMMTGGDTPQIMTICTQQASPAPTATTLRVVVTNAGDAPRVGDNLAYSARGGTWRAHAFLTAVATVNSTTFDLTFAPVVDVPDSSGDARWSVSPGDLEVAYNFFTKPVEWRDNTILPVPIAPVIAGVAGGTLAAGSYTVRMASRATANGEASIGAKTGSVTVTVPANGKITMSWTAPPVGANIEFFRAYVTHPDATIHYVSTATALITTLEYTATSASTVASFASDAKWGVKNLFELKVADGAHVHHNIFENSWPGVGNGYAWWLKTVNQYIGVNTGAPNPGALTRNVLIEKNIVRHVAGFMNISGSEVSVRTEAIHKPRVLKGLTVTNNLFYDSGGAWAQGSSMWALNIANGCHDLVITKNTMIHDRQGMATLTGNVAQEKLFQGLIFRDNIQAFRHTYGWKGATSGLGTGEGTPVLESYTALSYTFTNNALAGATASVYPAGNLFPTTNDLTTLYFENYAAFDFRLKAGSPAIGAGSGGSDMGAAAATILSETAGVIVGSVTAPSTPTIVTTVLQGGTVGIASSEQISVSGGDTPYTFAVTSGTIVPGWSLNTTSGLITKNPTTPGTYAFTVTVTDDNAATDPQAYSGIVIVAAPVIPNVNIVPAALPGGSVAATYDFTLQATGGVPPYTWSIDNIEDLPEGMTFDGGTGTLGGAPINPGTTVLDFRVVDLNGQAATAILVLVVASSTGFTVVLTKLNQVAANWKRLRVAPVMTQPEYIQKLLDDAVKVVRAQFDKERGAEVSVAYTGSESLEVRNEVEQDLGITQSGLD